MSQEIKTEVCPLGLTLGRLLVAAQKQFQGVVEMEAGLEWIEEGKGDEEPATKSVHNSEISLWSDMRPSPKEGVCVATSF